MLQGTTIFGDVRVVEKQVQDKTLLWHFRLGHMSENGLKELEKHGALGGDKISAVEFCEECVLGRSSKIQDYSAYYKGHFGLYTLGYVRTITYRVFRWGLLLSVYD